MMMEKKKKKKKKRRLFHKLFDLDSRWKEVYFWIVTPFLNLILNLFICSNKSEN